MSLGRANVPCCWSGASLGQLLAAKGPALYTYLAAAMLVFFIVATLAAVSGTLLDAMSLQGLAAISGIRAVHPYLLTIS